jgi:hypothetical protein
MSIPSAFQRLKGPFLWRRTGRMALYQKLLLGGTIIIAAGES